MNTTTLSRPVAEPEATAQSPSAWQAAVERWTAASAAYDAVRRQHNSRDRDTASEARDAARLAVVVEPSPDLDAFVLKLRITPGPIDDVFGPDDADGWSLALDPDGYPGAFAFRNLFDAASEASKGLAPQEPLTEFVRRAAAAICPAGGARAFDPADQSHAASVGETAEYELRAFLALYEDAVRLSVPTAPTFAEARRAYEARMNEARQAREAYDRAHAAVVRSCPDELAELQPWGRFARWQGIEPFERDHEIGAQEKAGLRPFLVDWLYRSEDARRAEAAAGKACDEICELEQPAFVQLMKAKPLTPEDWHFKLQRLSIELDDNRLGFDDPAYAAWALTESFSLMCQVWVYDSACLAVGKTTGSARVDGFSPVQWIADYEAAGGKVSSTLHSLCLIHPRNEQGDALEADLYSVDWRAKAVHRAAASRKEAGNDPLLTPDSRAKQASGAA